ncbi:hypothetical protein [Chryseobacterium sp.]|uniref:hypothetical protein n=1 Tax=Chryseobacterium sp. TaxID=1871047 RepID=UPI0028A0D1A3|nr:hypothetical protein [Chryseobacterium sp.]
MKINFKFIFISFLLLIYVIEGIKYLLYIPNKLDYFDAELLINYSAGFIRRGILGEIFLWIHKLTDIELLVLTKYFSIITYLLLIGYFIVNFIKKNLSLFFLMLPSGLFFLLLDNRIRLKDSLLLLLIIAGCKIVKEFEKNNTIKSISLNLILGFGILLHEMIFFYTIPFIFIYLFFIQKITFRNFNNIFFTIPLVAFFITISSHGFLGAGNIIFENIKAYLPATSYTRDLPTPLFYINSEAKNMTFVNFITFNNGFSRGILYLQYILSLSFVVVRYYDFKNVAIFKSKFSNYKELNCSFLTITFLIQLFCALPLYFVAIDWQRFIYFALISSFIYTYELGTHVKLMEKIHLYMDDFINKYIVERNRNLTICISTVLFVPHLKLGKLDYLFTNGYLMIFNYLSKLLYSIIS